MSPRPKLDPYEVLGVPRDADESAIKGAFRRAAKRAHPDTEGGDAAKFQDVKTAQLVLLDTERRAKFDATGEIDEPKPDTLEEQALGMIGSVLGQVLAADGNPMTLDLIAEIAAHFEREIAEIEKKMTPLKRARERAIKMQGKFSRKVKKGVRQENKMARLLEWHIKQIDGALEKNGQAVALRRAAIGIVHDHRFSPDPAAPEMVRFTVGGFSNFGSTTA